MPVASDPAKLLRPGLLAGTSMLLVGAGELCGAGHPAADPPVARPPAANSLSAAIERACAGLGARMLAYRRGEPPGTAADVAVIDAGGAFAAELSRADDGGRSALLACLQAAWEATSAVANAAFIAPSRPGRILYVAPATKHAPAAAARARVGPDYGDAARAGLENLARTLSIEWARYGITTVAIAPGERTRDDELAALVAYLASPAGAYFSGCQLDLRGPGPGPGAPG